MLILLTVAPFNIKKIILITVWLTICCIYMFYRSRRKKITEQEEQENIDLIYSKDDDGRYPWEVDIDDDPKHIAEGAKRWRKPKW